MKTQIRTLVADPPWKFGDTLPGKSRGAESNYECMTAWDIMHYLRTLLEPGGHGGDPAAGPPWELAPDCRLFLWRVASMQEEALRVMRAWGFTPKAEIVWIKKTASGKRWFGMGRQVRMEHETCLVGTMGQPEVLSKSVRSCITAPYTRHSGKPEAFYKAVEELSPGPYLELFARTSRPGWVQIGDQLEEEQ